MPNTHKIAVLGAIIIYYVLKQTAAAYYGSSCLFIVILLCFPKAVEVAVCVNRFDFVAVADGKLDSGCITGM